MFTLSFLFLVAQAIAIHCIIIRRGVRLIALQSLVGGFYAISLIRHVLRFSSQKKLD